MLGRKYAMLFILIMASVLAILIEINCFGATTPTSYDQYNLTLPAGTTATIWCPVRFDGPVEFDGGVYSSSATGIHLFSEHHSSQTAFTTKDVYEFCCGTTGVLYAGRFVQTAQSEVRYVGKYPRWFVIRGLINGLPTSANEIYGAAIYINNNKMENSYVRRYFSSTANDYGNLIPETSALLNTNDLISVKIANEDATHSFNMWTWHLIIGARQ